MVESRLEQVVVRRSLMRIIVDFLQLQYCNYVKKFNFHYAVRYVSQSTTSLLQSHGIADKTTSESRKGRHGTTMSVKVVIPKKQIRKKKYPSVGIFDFDKNNNE